MMKLFKLKLLLVLSIALIFGCDSSEVDNKRFSSSTTKVDQNSSDAEAEKINLTSIKLKNCDQLLRTMSKLTGIDYADADIKKAYEEIKGACPTSSDLDNLSPSNISLAVKLSMEFCGKYADKINSEKLVPSLDFGKSPKDAFSSAAKKDLFLFLYNTVWNGDVRSDVPSYDTLHDSSEKLLSNLLEQAEEVADKAGATKFVVQGLCTPIMSSAPVTTL